MDVPSNSTALAPSLDELVGLLHDVEATRYFTAIGMVLMLYDHALTFVDEVHLVWKARPSFARTLFLTNRYVVVSALICAAAFTNHFSDGTLSKESCQAVMTSALVLGIVSNFCANILVMLRVISLWDRSYRVAAFLAIAFLASISTTLYFLISIVRESYNGYEYASILHSCTTLMDMKKLPGVWASLMVFELIVLVFVISNALSIPRGSGTPLRRVLYRDGIFFFASISSLEALNLILSVAARPNLHASSVLFVWSLTTLILSRSILHILRVSASSSSHSLTAPSLSPSPYRHTYAFSNPNSSRQSESGRRERRQEVGRRGIAGVGVSNETFVQAHVCQQCSTSPVPEPKGIRILNVDPSRSGSAEEADVDSESQHDDAFGQRTRGRCTLANVPAEAEFVEWVDADRWMNGRSCGHGTDIELESRSNTKR